MSRAASRPSMAALRSATAMLDVVMAFSCGVGLRRLLRLCGLRLLAGEPQYGVGLALECRDVDLHAVEHGAPMPHDRRHGDGLADFLGVGAIGLGGRRVEIDG